MLKYTFIMEDGNGVKVEHTIEDEVAARAIIRQFRYFMLGLSFHSDTISDAMMALGEEYSPEIPENTPCKCSDDSGEY